jgi:hypothetical protein
MHHIMLLLAHMCSYTLDHAEAQAQAEKATNTELTEGKPRCIPSIILAFILITTVCYICLCIKFVGVDWNVDAL